MITQDQFESLVQAIKTTRFYGGNENSTFGLWSSENKISLTAELRAKVNQQVYAESKMKTADSAFAQWDQDVRD